MAQHKNLGVERKVGYRAEDVDGHYTAAHETELAQIILVIVNPDGRGESDLQSVLVLGSGTSSSD